MKISLLFLQKFTKFTKAGLGIFIGNRPLRCMLWILCVCKRSGKVQKCFCWLCQAYPTINIENSIAIVYAQTIPANKPTSKIGDIGIEK